MLVKVKPIYVTQEEIATMILIESVINPFHTVKSLQKEVVEQIRLELRVNGFRGLQERVANIQPNSLLKRANLDVCYKVATKLIAFDPIKTINEILQPKPLIEEVQATI